jgi:hypothetical protein
MFGLGYGPDGATLWDSTDDGYTWIKLSPIGQPDDAPINETTIVKVKPNRFLAISRDSALPIPGHTSPKIWEDRLHASNRNSSGPELLQLKNVLLLFGRQWD